MTGALFFALFILEVHIFVSAGADFYWRKYSDDKKYPVSDFENAKIFDGKSFWEVGRERERVDC